MTATQVLQKELRQLRARPVEGFSVSIPNENNILKWNVAIFGPPDTLYQGGYFKAQLMFPNNYPFAPPKMRFSKPLHHPNIYNSGETCISILHPPTEDPLSGESVNERWNPTLGVRTILISVISMLSEPNVSSPANVEASVQFRAWKEKRSEVYAKIIKQQVEQSKKDALIDGVVIPQNIEEYMKPAEDDKRARKSAPLVTEDVFANMYDDE